MNMEIMSKFPTIILSLMQGKGTVCTKRKN